MIRIVLCSTIMILCLSAAAMAVPMTWTDEIDFSPDVRISPFNGKEYFHNITDNGFESALDSGDDTISAYRLTISIYDDNEPTVIKVGFLKVTVPDGFESATVWTLGGIHSYNFDFSSEMYEGGLLGIADILHDGTLNVSVSSGGGDFFLASSVLTVYGDNGDAPLPPVTQAPEPASLFLMGSGLLGIALCGRRRFLKKQ